MPPMFGYLHCPLEMFIYLKRKFFYFICGRPRQGEDEDASRLFVRVGIATHALNFLDEPHFPFRPTPPLTSPVNDHLQQPRRCKRKALLIGVEDNELPRKPGFRPLKGPHKDIQNMRQFLIDRWRYVPEEINVLINTDDPETVQPTKKNIEKYCAELVAGACKGDCFFFLFAGHALQEPAEGDEEEDGRDEYIVTSDNDKIQDNALRKMLVDPLPAGARLVAIFDACHSATLLDLEHHKCNRVYVPWVNKGFRRTQSRWNNVVRQCALAGSLRSSSIDSQEIFALPAVSFSPHNSVSLTRDSMILSWSPTTSPANVVAEVFHIPPTQARPSRRSTLTSITLSSAPDGGGRWYNSSRENSIHICDSPFSRYCTGNCRTNGLYFQPLYLNDNADKADVICLSSAKDSQRSWQTQHGSSLTQVLIEYLEKTPKATIRDVLTAVSHGLHAFSVDMHQEARKYKQDMKDFNYRRWIKGKPPRKRRTVEMDNFQDPQISSHKPLDMDRLWEM